VSAFHGREHALDERAGLEVGCGVRGHLHFVLTARIASGLNKNSSLRVALSAPVAQGARIVHICAPFFKLKQIGEMPNLR
jgi:hypothetical protein